MRNMDRWLGNGGMPIMDALGAAITGYGASEGSNTAYSEGSWVPSELSCNPHGLVQAGVQSVVLDAMMNFAVNASLEKGEMARATIEMKVELMKPLFSGKRYLLRGWVNRLTRQLAFAEATIKDEEGNVLSRSTGTFLLARQEASAP